MKQALSLSADGEGAVQEGDEMAVNADKIINIARAEIGTKATNIKKCKYNNWYYGTTVSGSGYDWCETFVQWVFHQAGASSLLYTKTANCGYAAKAFQDHGRLKMSGFKRGDVVFFHWTNERSTLVPGTYVSDHVGIIERSRPSRATPAPRQTARSCGVCAHLRRYPAPADPGPPRVR